MKNVRIILALMASVFFLSHCGKGADAPNETPTTDLTGNECIAGVYTGEGDVRWNSWASDQDLVVSIAFQGASALVKVQGDDGDLLCTQYEGLQVTTGEEGVSVLSAARVTSSRTEGTATYSSTLANSLLDIQVISSDEDSCAFNIGSVNKAGDRKEDDSIESSQLERNADQQADFNALLDECGGVDSFLELAQEVEEDAEAEEDVEAEDAEDAS